MIFLLPKTFFIPSSRISFMWGIVVCVCLTIGVNDILTIRPCSLVVTFVSPLGEVMGSSPTKGN